MPKGEITKKQIFLQKIFPPHTPLKWFISELSSRSQSAMFVFTLSVLRWVWLPFLEESRGLCQLRGGARPTGAVRLRPAGAMPSLRGWGEVCAPGSGLVEKPPYTPSTSTIWGRSEASVNSVISFSSKHVTSPLHTIWGTWAKAFLRLFLQLLNGDIIMLLDAERVN